jgi:hypothetical protein
VRRSGTASLPATAPEQQPQKSGAKKWLPVAGAVAAAGVIGAGSLAGWFGIGEPSIDDCGTDGAEFKILGIQDEEMTWPDFEAASVDR